MLEINKKGHENTCQAKRVLGGGRGPLRGWRAESPLFLEPNVGKIGAGTAACNSLARINIFCYSCGLAMFKKRKVIRIQPSFSKDQGRNWVILRGTFIIGRMR